MFGIFKTIIDSFFENTINFSMFVKDSIVVEQLY